MVAPPKATFRKRGRSKAAFDVGLALLVGALAVALIIAGLIAWFVFNLVRDEGPQYTVVEGRSLQLYFPRPEILDEVAYVDGDGQLRVIRPSQPNRRLAAVNVTIVNRTTTIVPMFIDTRAAQLGDRRGERIWVMDPFQAAQPGQSDQCSVSRDTGLMQCKYTPFLWGKVDLVKDYQISGWMLFEIPRDLKLDALWWNEADDIVASFAF